MLGDSYLAILFTVLGPNLVGVMELTSTLGASQFVSARAVRTVPHVLLL